ncbi:MAG: hypothetical protein IJ672_05615 [Methanobrevibacter sp.]|nr:hypothetical protein [Methanobrevibacter sp.]MBR1610946.1 hypothetical protein [Methanobrevibacter sp.]
MVLKSKKQEQKVNYNKIKLTSLFNIQTYKTSEIKALKHISPYWNEKILSILQKISIKSIASIIKKIPFFIEVLELNELKINKSL